MKTPTFLIIISQSATTETDVKYNILQNINGLYKNVYSITDCAFNPKYTEEEIILMGTNEPDAVDFTYQIIHV